MSFDQGRESLDTPSSPVVSNRHSGNENDLPQAPQSHLDTRPPESKGEPLSAEVRERLEHVLNSDIGLTTLLNRLKQSLSSARDFSTFLRERAILEEKHAQSLKRLSRSTHETVRRPESRSGTFVQAFEDSTKIHDRIADNGLQFAQGLNHMQNELQEMMTNTERSRKHWKHTGMEAENRVTDAEAQMGKARGRYNNLAEQYDRARTGEKSGGKFGIKGVKSAAQQEEDLHRKVEAADGEYAAKVQAAQAARQDLVSTHRPQAVRALQAVIKECDSALSMQFAKYATLTERMLLGNGLCVSPLKNQDTTARSLREIVRSVDNDRDFNDHVSSFSAKASQRGPDIRYEKHPTMGAKQQMPHQAYGAQPQNSTPDRINTGFNGPYDHNRQFSQSEQMSGVMPSAGGFSTTPGSASQQRDYNQSPFNNSPLPQLPPISLSEDSNGKTDTATPSRSPQNNQFGHQGRPSMDTYGNNQGSAGLGSGSRPSMDTYGSPPMGSGQFGSRPQEGSIGGPGSTTYRGPSSNAYGGPQLPPTSFDPSRSQGPSTNTDALGNRGPSSNMYGSSQLPSTTFDPSRSQGAGGPSLPPTSFDPSRSQGTGGSSLPQTTFDPARSQGPPTGSDGPGSREPSMGMSGAIQSPYNSQSYQSPQDSRGSFTNPLQQPSTEARPSSGPQNGLTSPAVTSPTAAGILPSTQRRTDMQRPNLPPLRPVFGVSLEELFKRDGTAVPNIVYECIKAVDKFGLDTEGIYRTSGSAPNIMQMKAQFDHGTPLPLSPPHPTPC